MSVSAEQDGKTVIELPESTLPVNTRKGGKFSMIKKGNKVVYNEK